MKTRRSQLSALLTCSLVLMVSAVPLLLTWRQWQQVRLTAHLLNAIERNDVRSALSDLQHGADPNIRSTGQAPASFWEMLRQRWHPVPAPVNAPMSALLLASLHSENTRLIQALLEHGADPNTAGFEHMTPLTFAVHTPFHDTVRVLLKHGADPNVKTMFDMTPLYMAVGDEENTRLLLEYHAEVNTKAAGNVTPLLYAISRGKTSVVALLLAHHADIHAADEQGTTPLLAAQQAKRAKVVQLLKKAGAVR